VKNGTPADDLCVILLDTHMLVWLDEASLRLGTTTIEQIDSAFQSGEVTISAISFWEVSMLVRKGRIRLDMDLAIWRSDFLEQGLIEIPVTGEIGIRAAGFENFHGDPADRLIAATALQCSATLLTADERLLSSQLAISRLDARL
jgi:PIN domain nuclease of toxin-antitoxin system